MKRILFVLSLAACSPVSPTSDAGSTGPIKCTAGVPRPGCPLPSPFNADLQPTDGGSHE